MLIISQSDFCCFIISFDIILSKKFELALIRKLGFSVLTVQESKIKMNFAFCVKFLFAIIIGLTLISNSHAEVTTETFETMMNFTINECKVKENASDEDVVAIMSLDGDWPDTRGGKCFLDCFLEEVGIVRNLNILWNLESKF